MSKANKDTPIIPPSKNAKGFSTALLLGLSPVQSSLFEMSEGVVENPRLNTSASAVQGDTSSMMNDFLTADLMQKIEQLSPISSNQQIKTRMSDVLMINCDDNNSSSGSSDDNSNLYTSSDTSEELELKEDEKTKKKNKKNTNINKAKPPFALNEQLKDNNIHNIDIATNMQQQHVTQKMKNFEKKFNKSFSAGITHKNSSNDHVLFIDGGKHSHSLGGVNSNNNNNNNVNKSQVYSYYDSTSRYLSQVLQIEETEKNESKGCDSLNNSHNYIPKNFLGLGNNANLSGSNSTTSYGIEPFNKSDKDRNSNNVFDGVNANNIYEYTANQYNNQFQQQLNNHFDTWNNNNNNNNINNGVGSNNINASCNNENNLFMNKMISHNIMNQQRTPVTMRSGNGGFIDGGGMISPFIFDARPPQLQPFTNAQPFNNNIAMINNNTNPFYFTQMQMMQQKNFMDFTNTMNKQSNNNPFPSREDSNTNNTNNTVKENESTPFVSGQHVSNKNNNYSYKNKTNVNNNNNDIQNEDKTQQQQQQQPSKQPHSKEKDDPKEYLLEMFGRLGWICNKCNNFNYETRNRCNRCSADKDPRSLIEIQKKNKEKEEAQNKKKNKEQKVDWVCSHCSNLNFGFRKLCNRCQMPKTQQQQQQPQQQQLQQQQSSK